MISKLRMPAGKRTLYILCFAALNLIEFLRGSQTGDVWKAAANCTGIVMAVIIFSELPLRKLVDRINIIFVLLCVIAMGVVHVCWQLHPGEFPWGQAQTAVMNVCWIGIALRYFFHKIVIEKKIRFKPGLLGWLWIALSILMILSVSGRWWPLWFLFMFGMFYLADYEKGDREALWDGMIDGTILSFFVMQIYAYGFRPYDELRYKGALSNSNMMALYYLIIYLMCLMKLHVLERKGAKWGVKFFYLTGAGGMLSFQVFTMCRTAWIVSIIITIAYGILVVRRIWMRKWYQVFCGGAALALAALLTFLPVYYSIRWFPVILHHPVWYEGEYGVDKVHSFDPADSEKYVSLDEFLEVLLGRIFNTLKRVRQCDPLILTAHAAEGHEMDMEKVDLIQVPWTEDLGLLERLTIYKAYWDDMTWFGNGMEKGYYLIGEGEYFSRHAQNLWLQMAYTFGIPAGVLTVVLTVVLLWVHGKNVLRAGEDSYAIIPFFVCVLFVVFGLMEIVWNPGQLVMFLMFFVQHPQLRGERNDYKMGGGFNDKGAVFKK